MWESIPKHWLNLWVPQWGLPGRPTDMGNTHNCHMGTLHSRPPAIRSIPLLMIPRLNWFTVWRAKKMAYPYPNPWRIKSRVSYAVLSCFLAFFQTRLLFYAQDLFLHWGFWCQSTWWPSRGSFHVDSGCPGTAAGMSPSVWGASCFFGGRRTAYYHTAPPHIFLEFPAFLVTELSILFDQQYFLRIAPFQKLLRVRLRLHSYHEGQECLIYMTDTIDLMGTIDLTNTKTLQQCCET